LACCTLNQYEIIIVKCNNTLTAATAKYVYVGHVLEFLAQAVRLITVPSSCGTSR
jgi:hypothetical protein